MRMDLLDKLGVSSEQLKIQPLWSLVDRVNNKNRDLGELNLLSLSYGRIIRKEIGEIGGLRPESYETYNTIEAGDTVLRMTDLQNDQRSIRTGLAPERGIITSAYVTVRPRTSMIEPRFLAAVLRAYDVKKVYYEMGAGVRQTLKFDELAHLPIPLPSLAAQRRIADHLDREIAEIDGMDAELDKLIETLRERKTAVLSAPWEESKVAEWAVRPLWSMFRREKVLGFTEEPMVSVFREHGVVFKDDHDNLNVTAVDRSIYQLIEPGWLVVNRMKAWQGSVGVSAIRGITSGHYICFRPLHTEDHRYLNWMFRSPQYRDWFAAYSRGVRPGQAEIDNSYLDGVTIAVPPVHEQRRIADELDEQTTRIDDMIADANLLKVMLVERHTTLITDVVNGAKEVPA